MPSGFAGLAMLAGMLGLASASAMAAYDGGTSYPPGSSCSITPMVDAPVPVFCFDPSGADQDEYGVPSPIVDGIVYVEDGSEDMMVPDFPYSTEGRSSVVIREFSLNTNQWTGVHFTLNFNTGETATPATNIFGVEFGEQCLTAVTSAVYREAVLTVYNVPDAGFNFINSIYPDAVDTEGNEVYASDVGWRIHDGQTASMRMMIFEDYQPGLDPGATYVITVRVSDFGAANAPGSYVADELTVTVPKCGTEVGPTVRKPKAKFIQVAKHRVKVVMTKGAAASMRYRFVVKKPHRHAKTYSVLARKPRHARLFRGLPYGTTLRGYAVYDGVPHFVGSKRVGR